jgi:hypothetical protein
MSQTILVLSPEDYLERFPIKAEEVPRVIGKPTFVSSNVVINRTQAISVIRGARYCFTNKKHALNT